METIKRIDLREATESSPLQFQLEPYSENLRAEITPLWRQHYEEIALYKDIPLSPDLDLYEKAECFKFLRIFTIRIDGKLLGYEFFFISQHPHYSSCRMATQDVLFLHPSIRKGISGYKFIKWCDQELQKEGIQLVVQHVKTAHNFGRMLERLGYVEHDIIYSRRLDI